MGQSIMTVKSTDVYKSGPLVSNHPMSDYEEFLPPNRARHLERKTLDEPPTVPAFAFSFFFLFICF